ncbi:hypothetical protein OG777_24475 [Micromonospora peucetia]|uniref:Uncharacterized protein n=1 Tax=Micromonospora peucetia TaxID=47871 RepID=A0A1C6W4Q3_9ACTN|nr:hypothetical protein [Micromonospora peucetia]MCX4390058.1 hypothetical protein [Micromonospora peucetia]WSA35898.1 hypothetical protein OIE14_00575 [Micromonospora peucetia]SCL73498.1 hypothetical protein GA0070608_5784 [Micromonospora peucetia]
MTSVGRAIFASLSRATRDPLGAPRRRALPTATAIYLEPDIDRQAAFTGAATPGPIT